MTDTEQPRPLPTVETLPRVLEGLGYERLNPGFSTIGTNRSEQPIDLEIRTVRVILRTNEFVEKIGELPYEVELKETDLEHESQLPLDLSDYEDLSNQAFRQFAASIAIGVESYRNNQIKNGNETIQGLKRSLQQYLFEIEEHAQFDLEAADTADPLIDRFTVIDQNGDIVEDVCDYTDYRECLQDGLRRGLEDSEYEARALEAPTDALSAVAVREADELLEELGYRIQQHTHPICKGSDDPDNGCSISP